jgi:hypothetical protein
LPTSDARSGSSSALRAEAKATADHERAGKLGSAADLLTEVRACELRGLR